MEMSGALTKVLPLQCPENTQGLLYIDKKGHEMKRLQAAGETSSGFTNEQSLVGLLPGICWTKSQSPCYSPGPGAVVTND